MNRRALDAARAQHSGIDVLSDLPPEAGASTLLFNDGPSDADLRIVALQEAVKGLARSSFVIDDEVETERIIVRAARFLAFLVEGA